QGRFPTLASREARFPRWGFSFRVRRSLPFAGRGRHALQGPSWKDDGSSALPAGFGQHGNKWPGVFVQQTRREGYIKRRLTAHLTIVSLSACFYDDLAQILTRAVHEPRHSRVARTFLSSNLVILP